MKGRMWITAVLLLITALVIGFAPVQVTATPADAFPVELEGFVETLPNNGLIGQWQVAGITVTVDALTRIGGRMGTPSQGSWVKVQGVPDGNGGILAQRLKVEEMKPFAKLEGILEAADANSLTVAGIALQKDTNTLIMGTLQVGLKVEVFFNVQPDGSLLAVQVRMTDDMTPSAPGAPGTPGTPTPLPPTPAPTPMPGMWVKFYGVIESIPAGRVGTWIISGRQVEVTPATWVDEHKGLAQVGAPVEVEGLQQADGSIQAFKIEVERHSRGGSRGTIGSYTKFYGVIESLPAGGLMGTWQVSGRTVEVTAATYIEMEDGMPTVGAFVEVKGYLRSDNSILADKIEVKDERSEYPGDDDSDSGRGDYIEFRGQIQSLPAGLMGDWLVSGRTVRVTPQTRLKQEHGPFTVGAYVEVKGYQQANGAILAIEVETKTSHTNATPMPPTPVPSPTPPGQPGRWTKFYGTVENLPAGLIGDWLVSGRTVRVTPQTRLEHGPFTIGVYVEVEGYLLADGSVQAVKIERKNHNDDNDDYGNGPYIEFRGQIQSLPAGLMGDWLVSGRIVRVTPQTRLKQEHGPFTVGAYVEVKGYQQADGAILAMKIETKNPYDEDDDGGMRPFPMDR